MVSHPLKSHYKNTETNMWAVKHQGETRNRHCALCIRKCSRDIRKTWKSMSSLHKFAEDYWKSCFLSHLNRIHACHVEVIILDTVISSFVFSYMVKRSLLRLCDCRRGSAVPVLSINISFMGYIVCNKSVMFKPEFQDIKKGKKCHKVKFLAQETWKPYCRINNFSKLCLLESKIEQVHENDKVIWDLGDL